MSVDNYILNICEIKQLSGTMFFDDWKPCKLKTCNYQNGKKRPGYKLTVAIANYVRYIYLGLSKIVYEEQYRTISIS